MIGRRLDTARNVQFGDTIRLVGFDLMPEEASPGSRSTWSRCGRRKSHWTKRDSSPICWVTTAAPVAQADRLDVPGYSWEPGDSFLQLHQFTLPADIGPGEYPVAVGVYTLPMAGICL